MQESWQKDVERAFGVLQSRFAIICGPARSWSREHLGYIMKTCIILHNMIIEDEHDENAEEPTQLIELSREPTPTFSEFISRYHMIRSSTVHHTLRNDLIEHIWSRQGELD
ncbi:hypothetical protein L1049_018978 [Liquidambar formosana]|uniref:DDE Tnp4 domain-containing protein n=1 Tax=Liquidambar formosana TaxID=63359 RepID=A0AAP0WMX7_LIQFO